MPTFHNQTIGSHDDKSNEYVKVWYNETEVARFAFHDIGTRDVVKAYHRVHGVSVKARYVFAACHAFNSHPSRAIRPDGSEVYCTWTTTRDPRTGEYASEEFHLGDRYGKIIARMERTGYMQRDDIQHAKAVAGEI